MDWCKRKPTAPPTCLCVCARRRARRCGKVGHLLEGGRLRGPSQRRQWSEPGIWPVSPPTLPLFVRRGGAVFARVHLRKAQPCARGGWQNRPQNSLAPSGASWDATRRFLGGRFLGLRPAHACSWSAPSQRKKCRTQGSVMGPLLSRTSGEASASKQRANALV
jgi:hypothetical protein